jgi:hypothetical protein
VHEEIAELERRVREPVAEGERHLLPEPIVGAIADEQPLAVAHVLRVTGEVDCRRDVGQADRDRLREPPARLGHTRQDVGDRATGALPGEPALHDRGDAVGPVGHAHDRAVHEHDDHVRVCGEHGGEKPALVRRELDVGAVVALRLVRRRQPEHTDDGVGVLCVRHRLTEQRVVVRRVFDAVAGRERHPPLAEQRREFVEQHVDPRGVDLRATGALEARRACELADHGY